jgi:peroxiredoxin
MVLNRQLRMLSNATLVAGLIALSVSGSPAKAQTDQAQKEPAFKPQWLIPQNLLKLLHAPEVHRELGLSDSQVQSLEEQFQAVDPEWFRSRNLPTDAQYQTVQRLEGQVLQWLKTNLPREKVLRTRELLYRSQGVRMLLNSTVQKELNLSQSQIHSLASAAESSYRAEQAWMQAARTNNNPEDAARLLKEANDRERENWTTLLEADQKAKLQTLVGKEFDTSSLTRIYPMAPELLPVADWINSQPLTLRELRGKVVLLHFYAFQCHNCHANFKHYVRWHESYRDKGVVVLGIQTPETPAESDPDKVRKAAEERGLKFPILVDLGNKNWDHWSNTMWPTIYVIDRNGYLRHWWQGELNWQGAKGDEAIDKLIAQLMDEPSASY